MKKFKFKLQSVLDARERALNDAQLEMAKVAQKLKIETDKLDKFNHHLQITQVNLDKILGAGGSLDYIQIRNHQTFIDRLQVDIANQKDVIDEIEKELNEKKKVVTEALKAKKMMENLKEKEELAFKKEFEYEQNKEIDEIAITKYARE